MVFFLGSFSFSFSGSSLSFSGFFFFTFFPSIVLIRRKWFNQHDQITGQAHKYVAICHLLSSWEMLQPLQSYSLWIAVLSSSDISSLFFVFGFLGLASFPFSLASVVPFVSSFFFFTFYRFSLKIQNRVEVRKDYPQWTKLSRKDYIKHYL